MEKKRFGTKDLITVGIFTAIYFVIMFACGMLGYIPILYAMLPAIIPILCGIPFMLYLTKVKCFGMVSITGIICGLVMFLTGHTFVPIITGTICGISADLIFMAGKYKSKKCTVIGYSVFSLWIVGMLMPFFVMRDSFEKLMLQSMGAEYTKTIYELFDKMAWLFPIFALVAGVIGAFLGFAVLKKHFKRAGIA